MVAIRPPDGAAPAPAPSEPHTPAPAGDRAVDRAGNRAGDRAGDAARLDALLHGPPPDQEAVAARRDGQHGGSGGSGGQEGEGEGEPLFNPFAAPAALFGGDAILAGMEAGHAAPSRAAELAGLVDQVAERVLVGQRADGATEVRITLKGGDLAGTDVSLALRDGSLEVRIAPLTGAANDLLRGEAANLSRTLAERLGQHVVVEVSAPGGGAGPGDQRRGRSQGYEDILRYAAGEDR